MESEKEFLKDLDARINLESSRRFDRDTLEKSRDRLLKWKDSFRSDSLSISVVGSNGKGSTSFFLSSLFHNLPEYSPCGLFTSPHLLTVFERIRIGGKKIDAGSAFALLESLKLILEDEYKSFSYFEILTLAARLFFNESGCRTQVFEAGLGGRYDATLISDPQIVVLCAIEMEHASILGDTHEKILAEKLGIIGEKTRHLFAMKQKYIKDSVVLQAVERQKKGLPVTFFPEELTAAEDSYLEFNKRFAAYIFESISGRKAKQTNLRLPPARMQSFELRMGEKNYEFLFDPAHNPPAVKISFSSLQKQPSYRKEKCLILVGLMPDRDLSEAFLAVQSSGAICAALQADFLHTPPEGMPFLRLDHLEKDLADALKAKEIEQIAVFGSNYLYKYFLEIPGLHKKLDERDDL